MPPRPPGTRPGAEALAFPETDSAARLRAPSGPIEARAGDGALKSLLSDLGAQIRRGRGLAHGASESPACCPTGLAGLDASLGGGFPRGRLSELCGGPSSGRTSLATTLLAETLARGTLAAWIDPADAFDPASAAACIAGPLAGPPTRGDGGGDRAGRGDREGSQALRRLLWVRARSVSEALRSTEKILQTEGFELVVLDLAPAQGQGPRASGDSIRQPIRHAAPHAIREASWLRLARLAARGQSALVVLSQTPQTGSRAELVLEMQRRRIRFSGPPPLLDTLEATAVLRRHRTRPIGHEIALSLDVDPDPADPIPVLIPVVSPIVGPIVGPVASPVAVPAPVPDVDPLLAR